MAMIKRDEESAEVKRSDRRSCKRKGSRSNTKRNTRSKRSFDKDEEKEIHYSETNDISWYSKNPALLKAAASLPYAYPVGNNVDLSNAAYDPVSVGIPTISRMPGILRINVLPGPGYSDGTLDGQISAVNVAARDIYSYIRYANSGHSNYDPADLMMYMLAIDEVYMELADAQRAYGVLNLINPQNRYVPQALVEALGWDYADLIANMAQFRFAINSAAARIAALNMPMGFPYFDRHRWLFSNIYVDGTSPKAQIILLNKVGSRIYNETVETGSALQFSARVGQLTVASWSARITNMINALVGSEDCGIISGDILKAFGTDKCYAAQYMPDNYYVVPSYDEEVMAQIANATVFEGVDSVDITQDPNINKGTIIYKPTVFITGNSKSPLTKLVSELGKQIISLQKNEVTPEDTIIATRLTSTLSKVDPVTSTEMPVMTGHIDTCGSEIATGAQVIYFGERNGKLINEYIGTPSNVFTIRNMESGAIENPQGNPYTIMADLSKFRYHTPVTITEVTVTGNGSKLAPDQTGAVNYVRDIDTYTIVDHAELANMHEQCILSEFGTPITLRVAGKV